MAAITRGLLLTCVVWLGFAGVGIYDFLRNVEDNGCEMTWMYESMVYQKIQLRRSLQSNFSRYNLYLYGEGELARRNRALDLTGIPVLFIPGNAGSYKQVRSLGSVSLRKTEALKTDVHFNYFSVDLSEEFSGIFGGVLREQTAFVYHCIEHILTLYKQKKAQSVILVGHSMGGMLARAVFTLPGFNPSLVHLIITQATPHQMPVMGLDYELAGFYEEVNSYWRSHINDSVRDVIMVSTGGGYRDLQVRGALTSLKGIISDDRSVHASTMSVPLAWVSTDHLCSVWCHQMVIVTKRALFDMVHKTSKMVENNPHHKMQVLKHHFVHHSGNKKLENKWLHSTVLDKKAKRIAENSHSWYFTRTKVSPHAAS